MKTNIPTVKLQFSKWSKILLKIDAPKKFLKSNSENYAETVSEGILIYRNATHVVKTFEMFIFQ